MVTPQMQYMLLLLRDACSELKLFSNSFRRNTGEMAMIDAWDRRKDAGSSYLVHKCY